MGRPDSVHLAYFPEPSELSAGIGEAARARAANWDRLMEVRDAVLKSLEEARNGKLIGAPLEARVRLTAGDGIYPLLEEYARELPALFIVSQVETARAADGVLGVEVERAAGQKCERCWKYTLDAGSDARFPTICAPCAAAVEETLHG
jgi:isoleucyl-tRNA synthetase